MRSRTRWIVGLVIVGIGPLLGNVTQGHTPIASRFTYNEHLFPIFERQCGSCHIEGGVGPMSLLTYQEAYPWTQSIREEVLALRMPPWKAEDGFGDFSNGHVLPAHEMDMILEWSAGGYPQGPRDQTPSTSTISGGGWTYGPPTLELSLAEPFTLEANTTETVRYFVLPTNLDEDHWVTNIDVIPGSRAVVRHVSIYIDTTGEGQAADEASPEQGFSTGFLGQAPAAVWWPGQTLRTHERVGYSLPAGADIVARVVYKKTWITEGQEFSDQTRLGLHLTDKQLSTIEHIVVDSPLPNGREINFTHRLDQDITLYGLLPEIGIQASELQVTGTLPDGSTIPLLLIRNPDSDWPTRYLFDSPQQLPSGTEVSISAELAPGSDPTEVPSLFNSDAPVRLLLDVTTDAVGN
ncbi:MAG: hypothetical protein CL484_12620 [Acidobacteria bacterium]|nr:hypothetical protein [Acidobacteriota bacterium]|tara:strand:+ start:9017 stop:10237 length:1221 start_codon:yes stop_codon:yes gene_type:complete